MTGRAATSDRVRRAALAVAEQALDWVPVPTVRARALRLLGASVGRNVRVHPVRLVNLPSGPANLRLADDVHIGADCLLDLADRIEVGRGAVLSPRVVVLTHQDAGSHHGAPVAQVLGTATAPTTVGEGAYVGAAAVLLPGVTVGSHAVVAAGAVVTGDVPAATVVGGVPARTLRSIRDELDALGVVAPSP